jgi:enterochelin esterase-like enzyme
MRQAILATCLLLCAAQLHAQNAAPQPGRRPMPTPAWLDPNHEAPNGTQYKTFQSKVINQEVNYLIYLPPGYDKETEKRYPVIYWLHGMGGNIRAGAMMFVPALDAAIKDGSMPPAIVVLPNGMVNAFYCDTVEGPHPVESVIIKDLMPHIDETYRTIPKREARIIQGFSMGGYGAGHLGFKYPELFGTVIINAGALLDPDGPMNATGPMAHVFGNDAARRKAEHPRELARKNAEQLRGRTRISIGCGSIDNLLRYNQDLDRVLTELNLEHTYETLPDVPHNAALYYKKMGEHMFDVHKQALTALKP